MGEADDRSDRQANCIKKLQLPGDQTLMSEVKKILDTEDCESEESFTKSWGQHQVTLIHFASYASKLDVLNRADVLGVDLHVLDKVRRCGLHYAAGQGHVDVVKWFLDRTDCSKLSLQDSSGRTALHLAAHQSHVEIIKLLVDANADVNIRDKAKLTPLHLTWRNVDRHSPEEMLRYEKITDIILSSPNFRKIVDEPLGVAGNFFTTTILECAVLLNNPKTTKKLLEDGLIIARPYQTREMTTVLHIAAQHGFHQTLSIMLKYRHLISWMINMRNDSGQTPLHVAVTEGHLKCAHMLANNGGSLLAEANNGLTVIQALFRYNERPINFLTELLDAGVYLTDKNVNVNVTHKSSPRVTLDFRVLAPESARRQMAVVSALISTVPSMKQMNILQHPLVEAFLRLKWRCFGYSFAVLVIFQAVFIICLFMYGSVILKTGSEQSIQRRMLCACALLMLLHNIVQLVMIRKYYMKQFDTWLSVTYATICVIVAFSEEFGLDHPQENGLPPSWVLQSVSVAILLACIQMMLLIGRFPPWGYYALMFSTVLKNVLKVFLAVIWIIVGFSLSFSILFHDNKQFNDPWKSFVKTVLMMMGEYEYSDIFESVDNYHPAMFNGTGSKPDHNILLPITSRIVFLAFIMLASIVLMNFMIGLAVIDIQGLLNQGLILRLMKQAEFVTHLEQVTSHWIFRSRFLPGSLRKMLEAKNTIPTQLDIGCSRRHGPDPYGISRKLVEKLLELASNNENLHKKSERASSDDEDDLADLIAYFQEGLKKLQKKKLRLRKVGSLSNCNP